LHPKQLSSLDQDIDSSESLSNGKVSKNERFDEREAKIQTLTAQYRNAEISEAEYNALREEIVGSKGDLESTHLVRGLDRRLLNNVRTGLVNGTGEADADEGVEDEFEKLEQQEVATVQRTTAKKESETSVRTEESTVDGHGPAGVKRSRDALLAEMKSKRAADQAARLAARPDLGNQFKSIETKKAPKVIIDKKGREVIITKDEEGRIKKKVRKVDISDQTRPTKFLDEGVIVPARVVDEDTGLNENEADEGNMFEDVDDDYNPLGNVEEEDDNDDNDNDDHHHHGVDEEECGEEKSNIKDNLTFTKRDVRADHIGEEQGSQSATKNPSDVQPRNYFSHSKTSDLAIPSESNTSTNPFQDPAFLSAITRASELAKFKMHLGDKTNMHDNVDINNGVTEIEDEASSRIEIHHRDEQARLIKKREMLLSNSNRDLDDMDLGFGGDAYGEDDDDEGGHQRGQLREWKGLGNDEGQKVKANKKKGKHSNKEDNVKSKKGKPDAKEVMEVLKKRKLDV